jgi:hypothetical protein
MINFMRGPTAKWEFDGSGIKNGPSWPRRYSRGADLAQASVDFNYMKLIVITHQKTAPKGGLLISLAT